jgi:hypothetical protein
MFTRKKRGSDRDGTLSFSAFGVYDRKGSFVREWPHELVKEGINVGPASSKYILVLVLLM